ncbi:hypothetical protein [Rhodococcus sp. NPDC060176]|uniref:hypothetical protein n=1 Tax=Rhodococcus sp. NPDC060176 TaxID=3347062 RepID=UPI00366443B7
MYLADKHGAFRLLAFDFDAPRRPSSPGLVPSIADAVAFSAALRALGIPYLMTASGSEWGRHIWILLNENVAPRMIRSLAELVKELHPTLDISALTNPRTGCTRIPGATHRRGGFSTPVAVDDETRIEDLARFAAGTHAADLRRLRNHLRVQLKVLTTAGVAAAPRRDRVSVSPYETLTGPAIVPTRGHGLKMRSNDAVRPDAALASALQIPVDGAADHSRQAFSLLLRMAAAGWTRADVLAAASTAPALEYLRTGRTSGSSRSARADAADFTIRQWKRANDKFRTWNANRAQKLTTVLSVGLRRAHSIQQAASAHKGVWGTEAGVHRRSVLDALCLIACETGAAEFDIDQRRLALSAGVTQPTASRSLKWLREAGWINRIATPGGLQSDRYQLLQPQSLQSLESQGVPTPQLPQQLLATLRHARHDLWTRNGLGSSCGSTHRAILAGHTSLSSLTQATGLSAPTVREHQALLHAHGLITRSGHAVRQLGGALHAAATELGVAGVVDARRRLYTAESLVWEWWQTELAWRSAPAEAKPRRSEHHVRALRHRFPTFADGRADFAAALGRIVATLPRSDVKAA